MSAFSFTAPIISEEQEKEEYLKLAKQEREKIKSDLYGTNIASLLLEQEKLLDRLPESLILLQEALDAIPQHEKVDYLQALSRVPHLVERESPGQVFLQACNFDPWSASSRLVSYWKFRREAFGNDKAFQPMTLDGALKEDRHVFDLGFFALLPPDKAGRRIIFWNRIACTKAVATRDVFVSTTNQRLIPVPSEHSQKKLGLTMCIALTDPMPVLFDPSGCRRGYRKPRFCFYLQCQGTSSKCIYPSNSAP